VHNVGCTISDRARLDHDDFVFFRQAGLVDSLRLSVVLRGLGKDDVCNAHDLIETIVELRVTRS
jgi:hypothetical protein